jgi:transcriptional regulator of acetoin/glycerol metabolism
MNYEWPGNVRELRHTVEKAVILCDSDVLKPDNFIIGHPLQKIKSEEKPSTFAQIEKQAILAALQNNSGNIVKAARELGLARQTLYNKVQKYKLENLNYDTK